MKNVRIVLLACACLLVFFVGGILLIVSTYTTRKKELDLIDRELSGVLIEVKDLQRGNYSLTIKQYKTNEIFEYDLQISKFIKEYSIKVNDSISKMAGGHEFYFYRKRNGLYEKIGELYYY
jgi:signal transduction histidine kinase